MTLWNQLTAPNPASRAPLSLKALLYACLTGFFGWSFVYCGLQTAFTDMKHNPYGHPAMFVGMVLAFMLFLTVFVLWVGTFLRAPHMVRNFVVLVLAVFLLFYPSCLLCNGLYDLGSTVFHTILGD